MKKIVTFAALASGALALAACGAKKEEAPADPVEAEMMMPEGETPAPVDEAAAAAEDVDPTGNPIGPLTSAPAAGETPAEAEAPAAE
jgi:hypothetical protein